MTKSQKCQWLTHSLIWIQESASKKIIIYLFIGRLIFDKRHSFIPKIQIRVSSTVLFTFRTCNPDICRRPFSSREGCVRFWNVENGSELNVTFDNVAKIHWMVVCVLSKRSVCFCQRRGTAILGNILPSLRKYSAQFEAVSVYFHCGSLRALDTRPVWSQDVWKKDICSIQTATGISRCKIYSCFYLGDQKQVRIRLQPRFGLFAKSLMKPYSFVGPGLMHFCSPRTHLLSKAPPTQTPPLSPSNFRQGIRGLVEEMFAICQIYVGCAK